MASFVGVAAAIICLFGITAPAQAETLLGYLVDEKCAQSYRTEANRSQLAREHANECSLNSGAHDTRFLLHSEGKWFRLDANGNRLAQVALQRSISHKGFYASITGDTNGDIIAVRSLSQVIDTPAKVKRQM